MGVEFRGTCYKQRMHCLQVVDRLPIRTTPWLLEGRWLLGRHALVRPLACLGMVHGACTVPLMRAWHCRAQLTCPTNLLFSQTPGLLT